MPDLTEETKAQLREEEAIASSCLILANAPRDSSCDARYKCIMYAYVHQCLYWLLTVGD